MGNTSAIISNDKDFTYESPGASNQGVILKRICDPRSPSEEFTRTPLEVKQVSVIKSTKTRSRISHPIGSLGAVERGSFDASAMNESQRLRFLSIDPRSPTPGIIRTPIQVFSPESKSTETDDSPISVTSASSEVSEASNDLEFPHKDCPPTSLGKNLDTSPQDVFYSPMMVEEKSKSIADAVFIDEDLPETTSSPPQYNQNNASEIRVKLFQTPPAKASDLKVRTPLRAFSANESLPQQILRAKQARGIMENMDVENTPPKGLAHNWKENVPSFLK